jgi:hypothetical protein
VRNSLQIQLQRLANDRWARRGVRLLLRASTLAIALVCIAVGAQLLFDLRLNWNWLSIAALSCIALGALLVLRRPLSPVQVARRLDRRFKLNEQLSTALELSPQAEGVGVHLHEQARRTMAQIRRQLAARQGFPWPELSAAAALLLLLAGLLLLVGIGPAWPGVAAEPLPPLVAAPPPDQSFPPEPFQPPSAAQPGPGDAQATISTPGDVAAAAALAEALRDQSVTRPAAEALDRGNPAEAAQRLRELADQAGGISDQARADLARDLRAAANQIEPGNPDLATQVREAADGIGPFGASPDAALEDLADAVSQLGQGEAPGQQADGGEGQGGSGGAGQASLPGQQREGSGARLGVDGVPLPLESEGQGSLTTGDGTAGMPSSTDGGTSGGGFARGSQSGERVEIGDDPLRIPTDLRDVVQDYFSP